MPSTGLDTRAHPQPHKTEPHLFPRRASDVESRVVLRTSVDQMDTRLPVHSFRASVPLLTCCHSNVLVVPVLTRCYCIPSLPERSPSQFKNSRAHSNANMMHNPLSGLLNDPLMTAKSAFTTLPSLRRRSNLCNKIALGWTRDTKYAKIC